VESATHEKPVGRSLSAPAHPLLLVAVGVMDVRGVSVPMSYRLVTMPVRVLAEHRRLVLMLVVTVIMTVRVIVLQGLVNM
jgi:hypothetical protein